jgi:hypothetical protein
VLLPRTANRCLDRIVRYVETESVCLAFLRERIAAYNDSLHRVEEVRSFSRC